MDSGIDRKNSTEIELISKIGLTLDWSENWDSNRQRLSELQVIGEKEWEDASDASVLPETIRRGANLRVVSNNKIPGNEQTVVFCAFDRRSGMLESVVLYNYPVRGTSTSFTRNLLGR